MVRAKKVNDPRRELDAERKIAYRRHRKNVGEDILRAVMRMLATAEASKRVNELLATRLRLDGVQIDVSEVEHIARSVLRAEIAQILASHGHLGATQKQEFVDRFLSRLMPSKDGVADATTRVPPKVGELESMVAREAKRIGLRSKPKPEGEDAYKKLRHRLERLEKSDARNSQAKNRLGTR